MSGKKLSPAQQRVINQMRNGLILFRQFDVYGGYWWTIDSQIVTKATVGILCDKGLLILGETERLFSGRQRTPYRLCLQTPLQGQFHDT